MSDMVQSTTEEFGLRLTQALEASPHAPPTPHGRLSWLKRELEKHGTKVSVNTVHKWCHGASRPREDNVRALSRLLKVDEVWLALGRKPVESPKHSADSAAKAKGAVLMLAGLIEVAGGRVTFPSEGEGTPHLWANLNSEQFGVIVVTPQSREGSQVSFVVPEPVGPHKVLAVVSEPGSMQVQVVDLTDVQRQSFGGFSVVSLETRNGGKFKAPDQRNLLAPVGSVAELAA
ncbi:hypothetical protein P1J78_19305 [Psychromarinibacter sp. C21-152]|uniref:Uncharacterized protein n=1 Tax=Psychromarinibacter sediminicola TaxID=3033385 RepID=A0AAE3NXR5_9RHOB|nr:hypothetical protein [Psychromarinibacter sediminicola]MDF0602895.1 hypothetical protein [Psychromarinibacter sediminicola]